jgi:cysteine desulfurase
MSRNYEKDLEKSKWIKMENKIYLDHAATTPLDPEVFGAMKPYFSEKFGNSASIHSFGQEALKAIDLAREKVAKYLGCQIHEVIFTSGATESNNMAIKGIIDASNIKKPHVITSKIEHHSVFETIEFLEKKGRIDVSYAPVNREGIVNTKSVQEAIAEDTVLISIMYANNEIGTIQPLARLGEMIKKVNKERKKNNKNLVIFHTDAVQAAGFLDCHVNQLNVDLLSLSAHKFYGPKGIGILFVREGTKISPLHHGGFHEYNLRAGTLNVPGIVGLGKAIELLGNEGWQKSIQKIKKLRDKLIQGVFNAVPGVFLNGSKEMRLPSNANLCFRNAEGESILLGLDFEGIACSTGSACASGSLAPSHVLLAMGCTPELAYGSLRFTLGKDNTEEEIDRVLKILPKIVKNLRKMSPIK